MADSRNRFLNDIFTRHAHELSAFLTGRYPREQHIADIVQESFLRLAQYPNPESILNPRAFLFQTAANLAIDFHRRSQIRERHAQPDADTESIADRRQSLHQYWESQEALEYLNAWLDELPELQRFAFLLHRLEGCSHAEIAARLGISVRCSERYVHQAMRHISERLAKS